MNEFQEIRNVIEKKVRPALLEHRGDVELLSFDDGICRIKFLGQCSGCPSAQLDSEELIGKAIMEELPYVKDVVLVDEINPELLDFAKQILNHEAAL